ncbi:MAG: leucine-rich repeat protein [Bacilli bacterium]|nr:leucine-rich repeat protein [Bacilli bacterium]
MDDLKKIKNEYGEKMMYFCRDNFPTILETPGLLYETITKLFNKTKLLSDDINSNETIKDAFIRIIMNEYLSNHEEIEEEKVIKTPQELLDEAGYILYECKSEEDIQRFRHYYKRYDNFVPEYISGTTPVPYSGEELCTFNGNRLERCHVFFAVKKNVDEIKRENFPNPKRDDEYGTSVISIQFSRGSSNSISIKNRYNHTVDNPDATFGNDLDRIISGLSISFEKEYGFNINGNNKTNIEIPGYIKANDGKFYKYNFESNAIYYCPDNIIIKDGKVIQYDKSRYLLMGRLLFDFQEKKIIEYDQRIGMEESFLDAFYDKEKNTTIKSIKVETNKQTKEKTITINDDIIIVIDKTNQMTYYKNPHITKIWNCFLSNESAGGHSLKEIDLPNVETIGFDFLLNNQSLKKINLPKCKEISHRFLRLGRNTLEEIYLPEVEIIRNDFMGLNKSLKKIYLPKCKYIGNNFLEFDTSIQEIDLPEVKYIGNYFLGNNLILEKINLPKCKEICDYFLYRNVHLKELDLPELKQIDNKFLTNNVYLKHINIPKCTTIGQEFLKENTEIESINLPEVCEIYEHFMENAEKLKHIYIPKCTYIDDNFLAHCTTLIDIDLPEVLYIHDNFLEFNEHLTSINAPKVQEIGNNFLYKNTVIQKIDLPEVMYIEDNFLEHTRVQIVNIPKCIELGNKALRYAYNLKEINISSLGYIKDLESNDYDAIKNYFSTCKRNDINVIYKGENKAI